MEYTFKIHNQDKSTTTVIKDFENTEQVKMYCQGLIEKDVEKVVAKDNNLWVFELSRDTLTPESL